METTRNRQGKRLSRKGKVRNMTMCKQLTIGEAEKDEEMPPLMAAAEDVKPVANIEHFESSRKNSMAEGLLRGIESVIDHLPGKTTSGNLAM